MNEHIKHSLTTLYEMRSKAIDDGEVELVAELNAAIHAKNVIGELFYKAVEPQLVSRKRSRKARRQ